MPIRPEDVLSARTEWRQRSALACAAICAATLGLTDTLKTPLAVKLLLTVVTTAGVSEWFAALARDCAAIAMLAGVRPLLRAAA